MTVLSELHTGTLRLFEAFDPARNGSFSGFRLFDSASKKYELGFNFNPRKNPPIFFTLQSLFFNVQNLRTPRVDLFQYEEDGFYLFGNDFYLVIEPTESKDRFVSVSLMSVRSRSCILDEILDLKYSHILWNAREAQEKHERRLLETLPALDPDRDQETLEKEKKKNGVQALTPFSAQVKTPAGNTRTFYSVSAVFGV